MGHHLVKMSGERAQVANQSGIMPVLGLNDSAQVIPWSALLSSPQSLPSNAQTCGMHWGREQQKFMTYRRYILSTSIYAIICYMMGDGDGFGFDVV